MSYSFDPCPKCGTTKTPVLYRDEATCDEWAECVNCDYKTDRRSTLAYVILGWNAAWAEVQARKRKNVSSVENKKNTKPQPSYEEVRFHLFETAEMVCKLISNRIRRFGLSGGNQWLYFGRVINMIMQRHYKLSFDAADRADQKAVQEINKKDSEEK